MRTNLSGIPTPLPASPFAYGIAVDDSYARYGLLTRIDVATGQQAFGPKIPAASELFTIGSSMAVLSPAREETNGATTGPWSLRLVKGRSTSLTPARVLRFLSSGYGQVVTSGPVINRGDLWIGSGASLFLVNASTGIVVRRESLRVQITSISVAPSGLLLYAALDELNKKGLLRAHAAAPVVVDELNAKTGRVLEHAGTIGEVGGATLDAVPDGVWVSARSGMAGTAVLIRSDGLVTVKPAPGSTSFNESIPTMGADITGGITTTFIGSTVWLTAGAGVSCVAPSSGRFRAGTTFGAAGPWVPFMEWRGRLYVYAQQTLVTSEGVPVPGILAVTPPSGC